MATTTTNLQVASENPARGFGSLPCLHCSDPGHITVYLDTVDRFYCGSCGEEFGVEDVREFVQQWTKVLNWLDSAPVLA